MLCKVKQCTLTTSVNADNIDIALTYLGGLSKRLGQLQRHGDVPQSS